MLLCLQKYWPKPNADPLNVTAIEKVKEKFSKYTKRPEHVQGNRSKQDLQISECPPIKANNIHTPKSQKSSSSSKSGSIKRNT